jgi:hypothetical protein
VDERPLGWYAGIATAFVAMLAAFVAGNRKRFPERIPWGDVAGVALAAHEAGRILAGGAVASFLRAPVTQDEDASEPAPSGVRRALGELVTCPYCLGLWLSAGFSAGLVRAPRETRFAIAVLAAHAGADLLTAAFRRLKPADR